MNFVKKLFKAKEDGSEDVPQMKLGDDAGKAWYDEKAKKWRFKGEEIKEEETTRSVLPPKKQNNINSNSTISTSSVINNKLNNQSQVDNHNQTNTSSELRNNQILNNSSRLTSQVINQTVSSSVNFQSKENEVKNDPNSSIFFSCNEDKMLEEIRRNNIETLNFEKNRLENEFLRKTTNYERTIKNYESKLKEMENSQQYFMKNFSLEKEKLHNIIHKNEIEKVNNKFKMNSLTDNIIIMEKDIDAWKKLVTEYRSLIENQNFQVTQEIDIPSNQSIQDNFHLLLKQELEEKSKLVQELMESYISYAKSENKNKDLCNNINHIKNSYNKLLESYTLQERKFNDLIDQMNIDFNKQREKINIENNKKIDNLTEQFNKKLEEKENELIEKVSNKEIVEKNKEIEKAYEKIKELEDERRYFHNKIVFY